MIPDKIVRFLEERANIGFAGTRDASLVPQGHRVAGWLIGAGGRTLTALIPGPSVPHLVEALQDNGRIALTFEEAGSHETYQLKGRYLSHRPAGPDDIQIGHRTRERFVRSVSSMMPDQRFADALGRSLGVPSLAVEVEVYEVFLQTPGPGAGTRIAPPAGAEVSAAR
jgi:hypothetical protein